MTVGSFVLTCTQDSKEICDLTFQIYTACAVLNMVTDLTILVLPFWILRPMNVPLGRKIGIAIIMMGGGL
jgi:hypothetical protein